jgi:hypothetical protein
VAEVKILRRILSTKNPLVALRERKGLLCTKETGRRHSISRLNVQNYFGKDISCILKQLLGPWRIYYVF